VKFDRREAITIPPLPDAGQWDMFSAARQAMLPNFRQEYAAARYQASAVSRFKSPSISLPVWSVISAVATRLMTAHAAMYQAIA